MCQPPAVGLALTLSVLAEGPDASAALVVPHSPVGAHDDLEAVREFARGCDVVTFDHEHVPADVLAALLDDGVALHPHPDALHFAQDKLAMRERLTALGIPCPRWAAVADEGELRAFGDEVGWPVVLKTPRGGYDGKGVRVIGDAAEAADWFAHSETLLAEERVDFTRELAVLVARSPSGQACAWPVVQTVQTDGICTEVLAPAPELDDDLAAAMIDAGLRIAGELGVTGVMAVELFELAPATAIRGDGQAKPRPNSSPVEGEDVPADRSTSAASGDFSPVAATSGDTSRAADAPAFVVFELAPAAAIRGDGQTTPRPNNSPVEGEDVPADRSTSGDTSPADVPPAFVVNELAMRPHNSGHWTIDGAVTSQFEQHLRAVLDLPLGDPSPRARWTVMGNVLGGQDEELYSTYRHLFARDPGLKMHLYGKGVRPGRKIGHVTVCGNDLADLRERAAHAADFLEGTVRE